MSVEINLNNKTVLVTGGTRGIGKSIVDRFLFSGATVIATGTNLNEIKILNQKKDSEFLKYFHLDLSDTINIKHFIDRISSSFRIDILINNAGINFVDKVEKIKDDDFKKIQQVDLYGPLTLSREFGKSMLQYNWGRIVNIASIWSIIAREGRLSYSSSKMGLVGMSKTIALEWAKNNILVNCVSPGFTLTELTKKTNTVDQLDLIRHQIPQNRLAMPVEIANLVLYLCSNLNTYITGQNIIIDGGYTSK